MKHICTIAFISLLTFCSIASDAQSKRHSRRTHHHTQPTEPDLTKRVPNEQERLDSAYRVPAERGTRSVNTDQVSNSGTIITTPVPPPKKVVIVPAPPPPGNTTPIPPKR